MRNLFKVVLVVLSLIPLTFAVIGVIGGPEAYGSEGAAAPLDNQLRYLSAYYLSLFFLIWYVLGNLEERGTVLRLLILAIFLGGLTRLYSYTQVGMPQPVQMLGMFLELGSPILALWHSVITKSPKYGASL